MAAAYEANGSKSCPGPSTLHVPKRAFCFVQTFFCPYKKRGSRLPCQPAGCSPWPVPRAHPRWSLFPSHVACSRWPGARAANVALSLSLTHAHAHAHTRARARTQTRTRTRTHTHARTHLQRAGVARLALLDFDGDSHDLFTGGDLHPAAQLGRRAGQKEV